MHSLKVQFKFLCERINLCNSQNKSCYVYLFKSVGKKAAALKTKTNTSNFEKSGTGEILEISQNLIQCLVPSGFKSQLTL